MDAATICRNIANGYYSLENPILPRPTKYFDTDLETSIKRMKESERVLQKLPRPTVAAVELRLVQRSRKIWCVARRISAIAYF